VSLKVYLVLASLQKPVFLALERLAREKQVYVLVSYSILKIKPGMLQELYKLKASINNITIMLDSGAYHVKRLGVRIDVREYVDFINKHGKLFDLVVAPDIPGDRVATVQRTKEFMRYYSGSFLPVVQGATISDYLQCYRELQGLSITTNYWGVGGLDGSKKKPWFIKSLLAGFCGPNIRLHLFGVGSRLYKELKRYHKCIESIDTGVWSKELKYRRWELLERFIDQADLEYRAIVRYLKRFNS